MVQQLDTKADWDEALNKAGDKLVVVDFTATWCGPCKMIGPKFEAMSKEFDTVLFYKVDVDVNEEVMSDAGVSAMPTFQCYRGNKKIDEVVGASEDKLRAMIQKNA